MNFWNAHVVCPFLFSGYQWIFFSFGNLETKSGDIGERLLTYRFSATVDSSLSFQSWNFSVGVQLCWIWSNLYKWRATTAPVGPWMKGVFRCVLKQDNLQRLPCRETNAHSSSLSFQGLNPFYEQRYRTIVPQPRQMERWCPSNRKSAHDLFSVGFELWFFQS